jgi:cell fate regulator YaaT (PSP1 superfamily)
LIEVISVKFNNRGKLYYFDPDGLAVEKGDNIVVETSKGYEYGECARANHNIPTNAVVQPLRPVIRIATDDDKKTAEQCRAKEKQALEYCERRIEELGLDMKLVGVECGFEGNKILFFFTSDGRVDFRELVKDIAGEFKTRIELRQIGVRDEAKMLGGLGVCGRQFCCAQFLSEFHPVSIKMAKVQGLSLNPAKISGTCGRLMCCLKYEEIAYEQLVKKAPKIDAFVETPSGKGTVVSMNILRGTAKVRLEDGFDTTLKTFAFDELDVLGGKGRRAEYVAARNEGRLEEAGFTISPQPEKPRARKPAHTDIHGFDSPSGGKLADEHGWQPAHPDAQANGDLRESQHPSGLPHHSAARGERADGTATTQRPDHKIDHKFERKFDRKAEHRGNNAKVQPLEGSPGLKHYAKPNKSSRRKKKK